MTAKHIDYELNRAQQRRKLVRQTHKPHIFFVRTEPDRIRWSWNATGNCHPSHALQAASFVHRKNAELGWAE